MSAINEKLIEKYKSEEKILSDYYKVRDGNGNTRVLDGLVNPLEIDNRSTCSPTDDQRDLPACAGFSAITLVESLYWKQTGRVKQLNSEQCYAFAKLLDNNRGMDGTYLECSLQSALNLCAKDGEFAFLKNAKIGLFYNDHTKNTVETTKFMIHKYGIIQAGLNITTGWYQCGAQNYVLNHTNVSVGGHAVNLVYYDTKFVGILNQWGTGFGTMGYALMTWEDYLKELMYCAYLYNITF